MYSMRSTIKELLSTERGRESFKHHIRYDEMMQDLPIHELKTLGEIVAALAFGMTQEAAEKILNDLKSPADAVVEDVKLRKSLDELDLEGFHAGSAPLESDGKVMQMDKMQPFSIAKKETLLLDGVW